MKRVAFQMDPLATLQIEGDSTFALMLEAQARGYQLFTYSPDNLSYQDGQVTAWAQAAEVRDEPGNHATQGPLERLDLARDVDLIWMRQDPPFNMQYIAATHLLDGISAKTRVVNNPSAVRNAPEKLLVTQFSDFMPETLITRSAKEVEAFRARFPDLILKPLFGNGGAGVFHLQPDDENLSSLLETLLAISPEPLIAQRYLPEIRQGDKRIILIDGEPAGALNRLPAQGEARANLHVGGRAMRSTVDARDREICAALGPLLREQGLLFVGIDVIGGLLTEINVTSPTGLREISRLDGQNLAAQIWDALESQGF